MQEEYSDLNTLETRLHEVARRLNGRSGNAQGASQSQVPNGMFGPGNMPPNGMQPGMAPHMGGMMQQHQMQQHQMQQQQQQQGQQQGQGVAQMPGGGMPGGPGFMPQGGSMPMQNGFGQQMQGMVPTGQMGDTPQNFMGGGGPGPGGMIPTPNGNPGGPGGFGNGMPGGGMMSNGAPVLIRGNAGRDWPPSSSQPMLGVSCCAPCWGTWSATGSAHLRACIRGMCACLR